MSYSFSTQPNTAVTVAIPVKSDTSGATLTVEFAESTTFRNISLIKTAVGSGKVVAVTLTAADVELLTDSFYRVKSVRSGNTSYIQDGRVDYVEQSTVAPDSPHTHPIADVSNSTAIGRSIITSADAASVRAAIGAGTSNLAVGTTASTAKAGNYTPPAATESVSGLIEIASEAESLAGIDTLRAVNAANLKVVLAAQAAPLNANKTKTVFPLLEGNYLTGIGHSYLDQAVRFNDNGPEQKYINRVARRLDMVVAGKATGGNHMQDAVLDIIGSRDSAKKWTLGERGVAIIDAITNDAGTQGDGVAVLNAWEASLRALISYISIDNPYVYDDRWAGFTYSALWTDLANLDYYSGTLKQLGQSDSGTVSWGINTPGKWVIGFASLPTGREMELVMDGSVIKTFSAAGAFNCGHSGPAGVRQYSSYTVTFDVPAGAHTFILRNKAGGVSNAGVLFDYMAKLNTVDPVKIYIPRGVYTRNGVADSVYNSYNARLALVAADFPNVRIVDTLTGWDKTTMIGADLVHPSALGNAHIAARMVEAMTI